MYPPRSEKNKKRKQEQERRLSRFWLAVNGLLIFIIIVLGTYYYLDYRTVQGNSKNIEQQEQNNPGLYEMPDISQHENKPSNEGEDSSAQTDSALNADRLDNSSTDGLLDDAEQGSSVEVEGETNGDLKPTPEETAPGDQVLIHFAGDTIFSGNVAKVLEKQGYDYPYQYVKDLFQGDDLTVLNLETPVTYGGTVAEDKTFVFKSSPKALGEMAKAGVDAVNLANNHTLDQGVEGLLDTIQHLKDNKIKYVGAGSNSDEAYAPIYFERKGIKIALCGFSRVIPQADWAATKKNAGVAAVYDSTLAVKAIKEARKKADLVLVVTHWGKERVTKLEDHQTNLSHAFIDAGADLVIGGHPHVMQGIEQYKGKWVVYSTGNFIFTKSNDPKTWETAVFSAKCSKSGDCQLKLTPYLTEIGQPVPMDEKNGTKLLKEIETLSPGIRINDSGEVRAKS